MCSLKLKKAVMLQAKKRPSVTFFDDRAGWTYFMNQKEWRLMEFWKQIYEMWWGWWSKIQWVLLTTFNLLFTIKFLKKNLHCEHQSYLEGVPLKEIFTEIKLLFPSKRQSLTRWLPTTSILVVIDRIYRHQFKCNYLKNQKPSAAFFLHFWNLHQIFNVLKKNEPHRSSISGVIASERCAYLNA